MKLLTLRQKLNLGSWVVVACLSLGVGYLFNYFALDSDLNWTRDVYFKKIALANKYREKGRMLVFGGSHTHYSIDTNILERELQIPVFNMGFHGGLGLHVILECAVKEAKEGDIIVVVPEHGLLGGDGGGWLSSSFAVSIGDPGLGGVSLEQKAKEVLRGGCMSLPTFGKSIWKILFNAKGRASYKVDARGNAMESMQGTASPIIISNQVSDFNLERLKVFRDKINRVGAELVFSMPSVLITENDDDSFKTLKEMVKRLSSVAPTLYGDNYNLMTDKELFSDSMYHLNESGRSIASQKLAQELKTILKKMQH